MLSDDWFIEKGKAFQKLRKATFPNDTQVIFAQRVGISLGTIQQIESGSKGVAWASVANGLALMEKTIELNKLFEITTDIKKLIDDAKW